jgi:transposase
MVADPMCKFYYKLCQNPRRSLTMKVMKATELTDRLYECLEPLLPPRRLRGRSRADDREALNGILYVPRTGCRWQDVPREYGSPTTCWRRLRGWEQDFSVISPLRPVLLEHYVQERMQPSGEVAGLCTLYRAGQ